MDFNSIIFPAPTEDKGTNIFLYKDEILYVPKKNPKQGAAHIPCLYKPSKIAPKSGKVLVFFHGNAEDMFIAYSSIDSLVYYLPVNLLIVEYPGYSIYGQAKCSQAIEEDSLTVFDFLTETLKISEENLFVMGRSIGSGPSIHLASKRNPAALILISAFTSLRETAGKLVGSLKYLLSDKFTNIKHISKVTCSTLFIHGQQDDLIPFTDSKSLAEKCGGPTELVFPEFMDHNEFDEEDDLLNPINEFLKRNNLLEDDGTSVILPEEYFKIPEYLCSEDGELKFKFKPDFFTKTLRNMMHI